MDAITLHEGHPSPASRELPSRGAGYVVGVSGGFGIGLSIARSIAEGHKGSIHARQADGRIEFVVELK